MDVSENRHNIEKPLCIVFDISSLLKLGSGDFPPEFKLLQRLALSKKVRLLVPEMAFREWMDRRQSLAEKVLKDIERCKSAFFRQPSLVEALESSGGIEYGFVWDAIDEIRMKSRNWHSKKIA